MDNTEYSNCIKCAIKLTPLEIKLWKKKCHTCAAKAYKYVIGKLGKEVEDMSEEIKSLKQQLKVKGK